MNQKPSGNRNQSLEELRKITQELKNLSQDVAEIKKRLKPDTLVESITKGVLLAGVAWFILVVVLQIVFR